MIWPWIAAYVLLSLVSLPLAVVFLRPLSANRDRLDNDAPTHTQTGEAAR